MKSHRAGALQVIRAMYSSPPGHGAAIATAVLSNLALFSEWERELQGMAGAVDSPETAPVSPSCWHVMRMPG